MDNAAGRFIRRYTIDDLRIKSTPIENPEKEEILTTAIGSHLNSFIRSLFSEFHKYDANYDFTKKFKMLLDYIHEDKIKKQHSANVLIKSRRFPEEMVLKALGLKEG